MLTSIQDSLLCRPFVIQSFPKLHGRGITQPRKCYGRWIIAQPKCAAHALAPCRVGTVIRPPPPISALWRPQKSAAGAIPSSLAYNTGLSSQGRAKLCVFCSAKARKSKHLSPSLTLEHTVSIGTCLGECHTRPTLTILILETYILHVSRFIIPPTP